MACKYILVLAIVSCVATAGSRISGLAPLGVVTPMPEHKPGNAEFGVLQQIEVSGCTNQPCIVRGGDNVEVVVTFTPGVSTSQMRYYLGLQVGETWHRLHEIPVNGQFEQFQQYRVPDTAWIPPMLQGLNGKLLVLIYDNVRYFVHRQLDMNVV